MNNVISKILSKTEENLQALVFEYEDTIKFSEFAINILLKSLEQLKVLVIKTNFKSEHEEIKFFKEVKPLLFSKLIYQTKVLNIETKRPKGTDRTQRKYLLNELDNLHRFFDNNLDFYQYYRTGAIYLDDKYFLRGKFDIRLSLDTFFYMSDHDFSTSHDFKVSKILANDLLEIYLKEQLASLDRKEIMTAKNQNIPKVKLTWTDNKSALIEILYALYYQGSFNNGTADIKDIANYLETVFNIDLGDVYRSWYSIRGRKTETTLFLDSLKTILQKKIDQEENK
ncbi:RteC domain-containing protein [Flavobacterium muglaense]|uniref:RteC domain-containing protein n=1 Tax=Flavobacterium muglaense TaxID=2764716 RepID=A0A923MZR6_9FLAO|nr:RteC domain-containing protein [Flavobacterium muglaense]MBC5838840.1 RteC domain-containing protein [Flavobacterium muglaense]MBC5845343.1 RteC domain-containing protein [Flavobacterium muglaense]